MTTMNDIQIGSIMALGYRHEFMVLIKFSLFIVLTNKLEYKSAQNGVFVAATFNHYGSILGELQEFDLAFTMVERILNHAANVSITFIFTNK